MTRAVIAALIAVAVLWIVTRQSEEAVPDQGWREYEEVDCV